MYYRSNDVLFVHLYTIHFWDPDFKERPDQIWRLVGQAKGPVRTPALRTRWGRFTATHFGAVRYDPAIEMLVNTFCWGDF